jgi:hypothetical protein
MAATTIVDYLLHHFSPRTTTTTRKKNMPEFVGGQTLAVVNAWNRLVG